MVVRGPFCGQIALKQVGFRLKELLKDCLNAARLNWSQIADPYPTRSMEQTKSKIVEYQGLTITKQVHLTDVDKAREEDYLNSKILIRNNN